MTAALEGEAKPFAIRGAHKVDARGEQSGYWVVSDARGVIVSTGATAADGIDVARAGHAVHGTTRQVLSPITNPMDVICRNIRTVREKMATRPRHPRLPPRRPVSRPQVQGRARSELSQGPGARTRGPHARRLGRRPRRRQARLHPPDHHLDPTDWAAQHVWCAGRQVE